jgi:hypothetical protein
MTTPVARLAAATILFAVAVSIPAFGDGPKFNPPLDNTIVRAQVVLRADKKHLDGNEQGYISYRISRQGAPADETPFVTALVYPFEYTWNTQETYWNSRDPYDPVNGSRKYPDGDYKVTAVAFDANGKPLGEPTEATVRVANNVGNPPLLNGGILLQAGGGSSAQQLSYKANGSLFAHLTDEWLGKLDTAEVPPTVMMRMGAEWRVDVRKPYGGAETADGRRWHGQLYDQLVADPGETPILARWDKLRYMVQDEHIDSGYVELLGGTSPQRYLDWLGNGMHLGSPSATLLDLPDPSAAAPAATAGAAGMGSEASGAPAPGVEGAAPSGVPGEPGAEGAAGPAATGAGAGGATSAGLRGDLRMPVNIPDLSRKFRSVTLGNGMMGKMRREDPGWGLAELWTQLPTHPVKVGDTWYGSMSILPFFDSVNNSRRRQEPLLVNAGGGYAHWAFNTDDILYGRYYTGKNENSTNEGYGPGCAPAVHVLDGFEYYRGYECARIVSRFRNYPNPDEWRRDRKTGWWIADLSPRMFGIGQAAGGTADQVPIMRTDLTRVTYFAYRSGHVVGIEDHYRHQLWLNRAGFTNLAYTRSYRRQPQAFSGLLGMAGQLGLPGATIEGQAAAGGAAPGAEGASAVQPGAGLELGGAQGMGPGLEGAAGAGAGAGARPGWTVVKNRGLFDAPAGGGGAAGAAGVAPGMEGAPGAMEGGSGMPGAPGAPGGMLETGVGGVPTTGAAAEDVGEKAMCDVVAQVVISIVEDFGRDRPSAKTTFAAVPAGGIANVAPAARQDARQTVQRYVVVEETGTFYLPNSPLLVNQRGTIVETTAAKLIALGFRPAEDVRF